MLMSRYSNPKVLFATSLGAFIPPFTSSVISFSVPEIGHFLKASFTLMVWVPMAYLIALPSLMILFGKLSDIFGRPRFYMLGFLVFGAGGVLSIFSNSVYFLIFSTLVMGVGGSLLSVNGTAIVSSVYPPDARGGALGINAMSVYLGLTTGPILAGVLVEFLGWQSLFYVVAAFAFLSLIPVYAFLRKVDVPTAARSIDYLGFALFLIAILSIVLYLSFSEVYGFTATIYLLGFGLFVLVLFVLFERRKEDVLCSKLHGFPQLHKHICYSFCFLNLFLGYSRPVAFGIGTHTYRGTHSNGHFFTNKRKIVGPLWITGPVLHGDADYFRCIFRDILRHR